MLNTPHSPQPILCMLYTHRSEMVDAPGSTATVLELSKISDETYASPFQTTSNKAYNVVRGTGRTPEVEYEVPQNLPPTTSSSRPAAGDNTYEPV
ncbi:hypothetical protein GBAR_LOCUS11493 [Geodia barretti]|uniref:Uncharacterized protein n=1 Tax=Geodia barretti TaxID=519541 RepID=A0AA35WM67_GEOBA|nr:hypothetical protein GBAR_LOCUS11493 [Geodia barretti]